MEFRHRLLDQIGATVPRGMVEAADAGLIGVRDRALILLGFAGAFRRSELVALDAADLDFSRDGLAVTLRRSKTDQEAQGRKLGIPYGANSETCPVRVVQAWLDAAAIAAGPVVRSINRHGRVQPGLRTWPAWSRSWRAAPGWTPPSTRAFAQGRARHQRGDRGGE